MDFIKNLCLFFLLVEVEAGIHPLHCYQNNHTWTLPNILKTNVTKDQSIFFIETSCLSEDLRYIILQKRQACAIESVARKNPNRMIYVIFMASGRLNYMSDEEYSNMLRILDTDYKNIQFVHANIFEYLAGTPVAKITNKLLTEFSMFSLILANDVIKFVTLWRYGGIYLDLDVIVLKSFNDLPKNFVGAESEDRIGSAALGFSQDEFGREYMALMLDDYTKGFTLKAPNFGGSNFMTKITKMMCRGLSSEHFCDLLEVLPAHYFYPVSWANWEQLFDARYNDEVWAKIENSYMVHFWNKRSYFERLRLNSYAPYMDIAKTYCPKMTGVAKDYF